MPRAGAPFNLAAALSVPLPRVPVLCGSPPPPTDTRELRMSCLTGSALRGMKIHTSANLQEHLLVGRVVKFYLHLEKLIQNVLKLHY